MRGDQPITLGLGVFTQVAADTSYTLLLGGLFVMGLGMGMTMMPIMSAALASLQHHQIARGSTMMNIVQQTGGSIGTAVMSVILTNHVQNDAAASKYSGVTQGLIPPSALSPDELVKGQSALADAFGSTYIVALVLVVLCLIPALFLPRKRIERAVEPDQEQQEAPVPALMH